MDKTVSVITLGCRVNQYESQAMIEYLENRGISVQSADSISSVYIINTCTVTSESDRKARQMIRHFKKLNPDAKIIVTGCMAQRAHDEILEIGADFVCGNRNKLSAAEAAKMLVSGGDVSFLYAFMI